MAIIVEVTTEMRAKADNWAKQSSKNLIVRHSKEKFADVAQRGFLAEVAIENTFPDLIRIPQKGKFDFRYLGKMIEVKSRSNESYDPKYNLSIFERYFNYNADYFMGCCVLKDYSRVYISGILSRDEFKKRSVYYKSGDLVLGLWPASESQFGISFNQFYEVKNMQELHKYISE